MPLIYITARDSHPTIDFALQELQDYLVRMGNRVQTVARGDAQLTIGLIDAISASPFDDRVAAQVENGVGWLGGANPRSVLMAVYRFLQSCGCRFIRPGPDGECVPQVDLAQVSVRFDETPAYRHRGLCIEGAVSLDHVLASVDWCPKVGMNAYFLEFMTPFTFFDRWYRHELNPTWPPAPVSPEDVTGFMGAIETEIQRRGLMYHNPGHGWTCEPLGIPGLGWYADRYDLPPETSALLAEVNGKREVWTGVPLNTHLCYANPEARKRVVEYAVQYAQRKPQIEMLHVWLADAMNNVCECPACRDMLPADQYIQLLNELDAAFTVHGIQTRIVFIAYLDTLWPPRVTRFNNPERFVLLFAPISRSYSRPYETDTAGLQLPEFNRNANHLPSDIRANLVFLREWRKFFAGDSFTYEYHFMWDCYLDPAYFENAKVLHEDIRRLRHIGLNGIMSDQSQRAYFPTAFGMHVLARTLWDDSQPFQKVAEEYFRSDFGPDGDLVREYLQDLSTLFDPPYLRGDYEPRDETAHTWVLSGGLFCSNAAAAEKLGRIPERITAFRPVIRRNLKNTDPCRARSWEILAYHAEVAEGLARALLARAKGEPAQAYQQWVQVRSYVQQHEEDFHPELDVFEFITVFEPRFHPDGNPE
jgi:hypothetical protein